MSKASDRVDAFPAVTIGEKHAYLSGYMDGEQDNALTVEDVLVLHNLYHNLQYVYYDVRDCCKAVLELYNEAKREAEG